MKVTNRLLSLLLAVALVFTGLSGTFATNAATAYTANTTIDSSIFHVGLEGVSVTDGNYTNYRYIAQEFVPDSTNLSGAKIALNLTAGNALVHLELRSDVNGSALASNDTRITSQGNGIYWYDVTFGKNVTVTAGSVYYLVYWLKERTSGAVCVAAGATTSGATHPGYAWKMSDGNTSPVFTAQSCIFGFQLNTADYTPSTFDEWTGTETGFTHLALTTASVTDGNYTNYRYIAQEFAPSYSSITGASVALNLTAGTATAHVEIRSSVNGTALASNDVALTSQGNAVAWYDLPLASALSVTPGQNYYLVYWLTARTDGAACVVYGSDVGAGAAAHPVYTHKLSAGTTINFDAGNGNVVSGFRIIGSSAAASGTFTEWTETGSAFTHLGLSTATSSDSNWNNYKYIAQEFVPSSTTLAGVSVALNLTAGTATAHIEIRSSVNGAALASNDVSLTSQGNGRYWYELALKSPLTVTAGATYYAVYYLTARTSSSVCVVYGSDLGAGQATHPCYTWKMADGGSVTFSANEKNMVACFKALTSVSGTGGSGYAAFTSWTQTNTVITHLGLSTASVTDGNYNNYRYIAQEFVPSSADLYGAKVAVNLTEGNATFHMEIRSTVNGAAIASNDVYVTSKGNGCNWYELPLAEKITVTPGNIYYLVYYLIDRTESSVCVVHGSDVGANGAEHPGYQWKMADGGSVTFDAGAKYLIFGFEVVSTPMAEPEQPGPTDADYAQPVIDQITALPANITLSDEAAVEAARTAYNALTDTQKALVTNYGVLTNAETKITDLKAAQAVIDEIAVLPTTITLENKAAVESARDAYDNLTDTQKGYVTNLAKLVEAEDAITALEVIEADKAAAATVGDLITNLPSDLTLENKDVVTAARDAYNNLTDEQKEYVTNLNELIAAEEKIAELEEIEANKQAAQPVVEAIDALSDPITLDDASAVAAARNAYNGLTDDQKPYVTNLDVLEAAEATIAQLQQEKADKEAAQGVIDVINNLPAKITLAHKVIVNAVRSSYDALTDTQKEYVTNYDKLLAAEQTIKDLESGASDKDVAKAVVDQIAALPATITLDNKAAVEAARAAYNKLTDAQKAYVTNLSKLVAAENAIVALEAIEADKAIAKAVEDKIAALPETITLDSEAAVVAARNAYDGLSDAQKEYVTNLAKLTAAEQTIADLKAVESDKTVAQVVTNQIDALPTPITLSDKATVEAARAAYEDLSDAQKGYVTNLDVLEAAEKTIADLELAEADKAVAKLVEEAIEALPVAVTEADEAAITAARSAYDDLSDAQKGYVTNLAKLEAAEQALADLNTEEADKAAAKAVDDMIEALTGDDNDALRAARDAYNALTDDQKGYVTKLNQLVELEQAAQDDIVIPEAPAEVVVDYGDVDGDGKIAAADALEVLKAVVGKAQLTDTQEKAADADGDGKIAAADALEILKFVVGKINGFAAENNAAEQNQQAAEAVIAKINEISADFTLDYEESLKAVAAAYGALTASQRELVTNVDALTAAIARLQDLKVAQLVVNRIDALSDPITLAEKAAVVAARNAYEGLTDAQKSMVGNYAKLTAAEQALPGLEQAAIDQAAAGLVIARIDALSDPVTLEEKSAVEAARAAYNKLTDTQKALVINYNKLTAAEELIPQLETIAADKAAAQVVIGKIAALNDPVTLAEEDAVKAARTAYDDLTEAQQGYVTNYAKLTAAEELIPQLKVIAADKAAAQIVVDMIAALPATITQDDRTAVEAARSAYEGLSGTQQGYVTNYLTLVEAERALAEFEASAEDIEAAQAVIDTIEVLPTTINASNKIMVSATRDMYEALTDLQKDLVTNLYKLEEAEEKVAAFETIEADKEAAKTVDDMIDGLPATITLSNKSTVSMIRTVYESLTDAQKGYVTKLSVLEAAEATIIALEKEAADKEAAAVVQNQIASLPATITLNNKTAVTAARTAYNNLSDTQKGYVTNLSKLETAEATIAALEKESADKAAAAVVQNQIAALPSTITLSNESAVTAARTAYSNLSDAQKGYVTNLAKLESAEATIATLKEEAAAKAAAAAVDSKIDAIGTLTADNYVSKKDTITAARSAYNALTDAQKAYVTKLSVLEAAEAKWEELNLAASQPQDPANPVISEGYQTIPQLQGVSAYATPVSPVENNLSFNTLTQINQSYSKLYDLDIDCILAYEYGMPDDTSGGLAASWVENKHTYNDNATIGLMIAVNRDNGEYLDNYGKSRGTADIQTKADGSLRSHSVLDGKTVYYMVPTNSYLDYKWQVIDKYLSSGKIKVVALEEPELWNEAGYSAGYKELFQQHYGTSWMNPDSSAEAKWMHQKFKAWAFKYAFVVLSSKIKEKYPDVKVLVTTHGPLSYMHHGISTGASMYSNINTIDGVIGQTWSDDASQKFTYGGNSVANVFMNAMYAYNSYGELMSDGKSLYLLQDPASDNGEIAQEDLEENWKQTVVAAMMQNDTTSFQSTIWPQRAFTAMGMDYKTVQLSVNKMYQEFGNSDMYGANYSATPGVALAVSDSMGWHLGSSYVPGGSSKDSFSGIYMSLQNDGVPVDTVNLDTLSTTAQLQDVNLLIITYDAAKPLTEQANAAIATWVKQGGRLLMLGGHDAYADISSEWWGQKGTTPYADMFAKLGLSLSTATNFSGSPVWDGTTYSAIPSDCTAYAYSFAGAGVSPFMTVNGRVVGVEATVGSGKAVIVGLPSAYYSRSSSGTTMVRKLCEKALSGTATPYKSGTSFVSVRGNYFAYYSPSTASKTATNRTFINLLHPNLEVVPGGTGIPRAEAVLYYDITNQDNDDIPRFCFTGGTETAARYQTADTTRFTITNPSNSVAASLLLGNGKYPQKVTATAKSGKEISFITNWDDDNGALIIKANNPDVNDPITFEVTWGDTYVSLPTNYVYDSFNHFTDKDTVSSDPLLYSYNGGLTDGVYFCDNGTEFVWKIDLNTYKQASMTFDVLANYHILVSFDGKTWKTVENWADIGGPVGNLADGSYVSGTSNRTDVTVNSNNYDESASASHMYVKLTSCYMFTAEHPAGDHGGQIYSYTLTYLTPA